MIYSVVKSTEINMCIFNDHVSIPCIFYTSYSATTNAKLFYLPSTQSLLYVHAHAVEMTMTMKIMTMTMKIMTMTMKIMTVRL